MLFVKIRAPCHDPTLSPQDHHNAPANTTRLQRDSSRDQLQQPSLPLRDRGFPDRTPRDNLISSQSALALLIIKDARQTQHAFTSRDLYQRILAQLGPVTFALEARQPDPLALLVLRSSFLDHSLVLRIALARYALLVTPLVLHKDFTPVARYTLFLVYKAFAYQPVL